jgi:hypothetical protein
MADAIVSTGDCNFDGGYRQQVFGWYQENLGAGQAATEMTRQPTASTCAPNRVFFDRPGSIVGISLKSNAARSAGTCTAEVYKNGVATGLQAILNASQTLFKPTTSAKDLLPFVAGDELSIYLLSDGSWAPTTADLQATLSVET